MNTIQRINRTVSWALLIALLMAVPAFSAGEPRHDQRALQQIETKKGICAVLGDPRCELAVGLAKASELLLYVQVQNEEERQSACRAADAAGLYGTRIYVSRRHRRANRPGRQPGRRGGRSATHGPAARPKSSACSGRRAKPSSARRSLTKPFPDGSDDWSHHYHGPDNNPQSHDRLARAPYLTQFVAEPRYAPAPQSAVAVGGPGLHGLRPRRLAPARGAVDEHAGRRQRLQRHAALEAAADARASWSTAAR